MEIKRYISREADLGGPPEEPPEPIVVDDADHWEVECVLAERTKDRQRFVNRWRIFRTNLIFSNIASASQ
jgi:hypothetical protein